MGIPPRRQRQTNRETLRPEEKSASRTCGTATVLRKSGNTAMINCTAYGTPVFNGFELISQQFSRYGRRIRPVAPQW